MVRLRRRRRPIFQDDYYPPISSVAEIEEAINFYTQLKDTWEEQKNKDKDKDKNKKKEVPKFNLLEVFGILAILYALITLGKMAMGLPPI